MSWLAGWVRCKWCHHEWVAVRPEVVYQDLECPNCGNMGGGEA